MSCAVRTCTAALLLWGIAGGDASAYVRSRLGSPRGHARWAPAVFTLSVDVDSLPSGTQAEESLQAVRGAALAWSAPACSAVSIDVTSGRAARATAHDGVNALTFHRRAFCRDGVERAGSCYGRGAAAMTTPHVGPLLETGERAIEEVDIELNAVDFAWAAGPGKPAGTLALDLQRVLVHELGHALGFDHPCERYARASLPACSDAPADVLASVMLPTAAALRQAPSGARKVLGPDDISAVCTVYPATAARAGDAAADHGWIWYLTVAAGAVAAILLLVPLVTLHRRQR